MQAHAHRKPPFYYYSPFTNGLHSFLCFFILIFQLHFSSSIIFVGFECTALWLDDHILYSVVALVFPAPTWHCTQLLHIIDCIPHAALHIPVTLATTGLYFLIPSPLSPSPPASPLSDSVSLFSVSVGLFPFCLFVYFVL